MKKMAIFIFIFLLIPIAKASSIGIGVSPSKATVELANYDPVKIVVFRLWNEGDTDANFTISIAKELKDFVDYEERTYLVRANTTMNSGYVSFPLKFVKKTYGNREVDSGFYVKTMLPKQGNVGIVPQVFVKIKVIQIEDKAYPPAQMKQTYEKKLGKNYANFTWWASLWNETVVKAEHPPKANETQNETKTEQEKGNHFLAWTVGLLIIGIGVVCYLIYYFIF